MDYKIISTHAFEKRAKKLVKKYPSLAKELYILKETLKLNPKSGTSIGNNCYKIRVPISSKGKGKSGGARIITHLFISKQTIFLLTIYDKAQQYNFSNFNIPIIFSLLLFYSKK